VTAAGASSGNRPMISMHDVEKHFGALHVLKHIQLDVPAGQVVIVIGPSGSGKSTLCRTINRLEPIDSGQIAIDGLPLPVEGKGLAQLRADVGMVFQSFNLFAHKTILQNVTLGPIKVRKTPTSWPTRSCNASASPNSGTSCPPNSPADSSSGSPSPGRWP